jgi:hypothetical protein
MNCLENLINCRFLKNTGNELSQARDMLGSSEILLHHISYLPLSKEGRKDLYNYYMDLLGFKESFTQEDVEDLDMVYYIQEENIVWIASRIKQTIDTAVKESMYTTGDIPICRSRHFIHNRLFYTVMYDLTIQFPPLTTN